MFLIVSHFPLNLNGGLRIDLQALRAFANVFAGILLPVLILANFQYMGDLFLDDCLDGALVFLLDILFHHGKEDNGVLFEIQCNVDRILGVFDRIQFLLSWISGGLIVNLSVPPIMVTPFYLLLN